MGESKKRKQPPNRFEVGRRGGCEASLYEFREKLPYNAKPDHPESGDPPKPHTVRIAANTIDEALEYLRWHDSHFMIDSVQNLGIIVMASGSPLD